MQDRTPDRRRFTKPFNGKRPSRYAPRPTPYEVGAEAARDTGSMRGMPYGPGGRQDAFVQGFYDETLKLAENLTLDAS
jgi:hypothetical protein